MPDCNPNKGCPLCSENSVDKQAITVHSYGSDLGLTDRWGTTDRVLSCV